MSTEPNAREFVTANQVMARYGNVSHMWILRKQRDEAFPSAVRFGGGLRFFRLTDLIARNAKGLRERQRPSGASGQGPESDIRALRVCAKPK
jgi:predicted DNA-binding transcriptional regulator AlpA